MDVLLAYDVLGPLSQDLKPDPGIYEALIRSRGCPGEFSPSFTELQRHFVKSRPVKLKNLLRLVKFWYVQVRARRIERGEWAQSDFFLRSRKKNTGLGMVFTGRQLAWDLQGPEFGPQHHQERWRGDEKSG